MQASDTVKHEAIIYPSQTHIQRCGFQRVAELTGRRVGLCKVYGRGSSPFTSSISFHFQPVFFVKESGVAEVDGKGLSYLI